MSNEVIKYIEICYKAGIFKKQVEDWGPKYLPDDKDVLKIRFLSEMFSNDGSFNGSSSWIYYGERITQEEARKLFGSDPSYLQLLIDIESDSLSACITQDGDLLVMQNNDVTISEYIDNYNKVNSATISYKN